ncbi:MAG: hypothetical protein L3J88_07515 [Gammaproteobacteria bacterium]|nr:hypothetical protein [Gammaproteobacteria bacterium]
MLIGLGAITTLLSRVTGFELDIFYLVISVVGASLVLIGVLQKRPVS